MKDHLVSIFVNEAVVTFDHSNQTGLSIKKKAGIPTDDLLILGARPKDQNCHSNEHQNDNEYDLVENEQIVHLKNAQHFFTKKPHKGVHVIINRVDYYFEDKKQTGETLKVRAGIDLADVLFRSRSEEDEVIPNEAHITLHKDDCFHSAPPANYGDLQITPMDIGCEQFECVPQPDGWIYLFVRNFPLSDGYAPERTELLVKLPPGFPDAAPDMFWVYPHVRTIQDFVPQGTSADTFLGKDWQRFSWHLTPGSWRPGISTLRDFMRCIRSRFERRN